MTRSVLNGTLWIVSVLLVAFALAACGAVMTDPSGQGANSADTPTHGPGGSIDPDAPVSNVPGQSSADSGIGSGVEGRVLDASGNPVVGAVVVPQSHDSPPHAIPELAVLTSGDGRYQWPLPPGRYTFTVHHDAYAPTTSELVTVTQGQPITLDITVRKR
ncbi:MAG TPA: carboxypeptidase regulatory-like domain-containing protein [Herpetosiphonaceae bacterium]